LFVFHTAERLDEEEEEEEDEEEVKTQLVTSYCLKSNQEKVELGRN